MGQACRQKDPCCCRDGKCDAESARAEQGKFVTGSRWDTDVAGTRDLESRGFADADGSVAGPSSTRGNAANVHGGERNSSSTSTCPNGRSGDFGAFGGTFGTADADATAPADFSAGYGSSLPSDADARVNKVNNYFGHGLEKLRRAVNAPEPPARRNAEGGGDSAAGEASPSVVEHQRFFFESGGSYVGQWDGHGLRHGLGMQTWPDGASYAGEWLEDCPEGQGKFLHSDGDIYIGQWSASVAHGLGVYYHRDFSTYVGAWKNDLQEGLGVETWADGSHYEGYFAEGQKEGSGNYRWPGGSTFSGFWSRNKINGCGELNGSNGRHFQGRWVESMMQGHGKYTWADGRKYAGHYECDRRHGFGVFEWPNGQKYEGYWQHGKQHGYGISSPEDTSLTAAQGVVSLWSEGVRVVPKPKVETPRAEVKATFANVVRPSLKPAEKEKKPSPRTTVAPVAPTTVLLHVPSSQAASRTNSRESGSGRPRRSSDI